MKLADTVARIKVANVELAKEPLREVAYREAVEGIIGEGQIESCPAKLCQTLAPVEYHGFLACVEQAFSDHRPLVLSPDHIWLLICQGFANHVNVEAETLRAQLVPFAGKETLIVIRNEFVKGAMENDWEGVFPEFIEQMRKFMGATSELLIPEFSTTGNLERAACQIVMMEAMKSYFGYEVWTRCGIPEIVLEGVTEDWRTLRERARGLGEYGLEWWVKPLDSVLAEFCKLVEGQADRNWWNSFYKVDSNSGEKFVTGHVLKFFPYLRDESKNLLNVRNPFLKVCNRMIDGVSQPLFPNGLSKVPFIWDYYGTRIPMELVSGFVGIRQDRQTMAIRPEVGWAVRDSNQVTPPKQNDEISAQATPPKQNAGVAAKIARLLRGIR